MTDNRDEGAQPGGEQGQPQPPAEPKRGGMRFQDPETTTPRPPTLAEQRAMRRALEEQQNHERTVVAEAERKSLRRRRVMIGAGVTVGIVATVAVWYAAATPDEVTAYCVDDNGTVAADENTCTEEGVRSQGGYPGVGGFWFIPIGGGQYRSYHYNYGGTVSGTGPNRRVTGGTTVAPSSGTTVKSGSGRTVQRGGFGVSGGGKSGGSSGSGGS
ncbi:hypothetical protein LWC34_18970 [Kibdelosporangium philippinense]|uniref:Tat pathway signal protein n=1 Tax=Kibdelosporangium philippinense TaxID=211113 RepID=A0ABS8ZAI4_9PSEU|nr:hypothetical protein [Kibdelosporangium philippinense]MCE7004891.1 hypothetical protein [Kibdelosporangium philippinense]